MTKTVHYPRKNPLPPNAAELFSTGRLTWALDEYGRPCAMIDGVQHICYSDGVVEVADDATDDQIVDAIRVDFKQHWRVTESEGGSQS